MTCASSGKGKQEVRSMNEAGVALTEACLHASKLSEGWQGRLCGNGGKSVVRLFGSLAQRLNTHARPRCAPDMSSRRKKDTDTRTTQIVTDQAPGEADSHTPSFPPPSKAPKQQLQTPVLPTPDFCIQGSLRDVQTWQVIVYRSGKAWGRLVSPRVSVCALLEANDVRAEASPTADQVSVTFKHWQPVTPNKAADKQERPLNLPIDADFRSASFQLKVLSKGSSCVLPFAPEFSGSDVAASISQHCQRIDYIKKQGLLFSNRTAAEGKDVTCCSSLKEPSSSTPSFREEYVIHRGDSLASYSLGFDIGRSPAQLSSVEFKLAVVHQASPLDELPALGSDRVQASNRDLDNCNSTSGQAAPLREGDAGTTSHLARPPPPGGRASIPGAGDNPAAPASTHQQPDHPVTAQHPSHSIPEQPVTPSPSSRDHQAPHPAPATSIPAVQRNTPPASDPSTMPETSLHSPPDSQSLAVAVAAASAATAAVSPLSSPPPAMRNGPSSSPVVRPPSFTGRPTHQAKTLYLHPHHPHHPDQKQGAPPEPEQDAPAPQHVPHSKHAKRAGSDSKAAESHPHAPLRNDKAASSLPAPPHPQNGKRITPASMAAAAALLAAKEPHQQNGKRTSPASMAAAAAMLAAQDFANGHLVNGGYQAPHGHEGAEGDGGDATVGSWADHAVDGLAVGSAAATHVDVTHVANSGAQEQHAAGRQPVSEPRVRGGSEAAAQTPAAAAEASISGHPAGPGEQAAVQGNGPKAVLDAIIQDLTALGPGTSGGLADEPAAAAAAALAGQAPRGAPVPPPPTGWEQKPSAWSGSGAALGTSSPSQPPPQQQQQQQQHNAWAGGAAPGWKQRPKQQQQQQQQFGTLNGRQGTGGGKQGAGGGGGGGGGVSGPRGGALGSRHGGSHGLPSRGSSPALPTYRDAVDDRAFNAACSPPPPEPASTADLERFILQVTPMLSLDPSKTLDKALEELSLDDVWRFYQEPSMYGREVYTLGGLRGPSLCYFVPYLSAIQLFTPASPKDGPGTSQMYVSDTEGWPKHMHLKFEHFEHEMPFNRTPLYEHVEQLARLSSTGPKSPASVVEQDGSEDGSEQSRDASLQDGRAGEGAGKMPAAPMSPQPARPAPGVLPRRTSAPGSVAGGLPGGRAGTPAAAGQLPGSFLRDAHIADLHPASWFSVAWYPVYRIPDAPLCARFLTFHSFAPLVISMHRAHAALVDQGLHSPMAVMPLQVVGLKWYNMHGERWLEALSESAVGSSSSSAAGSAAPAQPGSAGSRRPPQPFPDAWQGEGGSRGGRRQQPPMDMAWQAHLSDLQATAERLARGYGLRVLGQMGASDVRLHHPDYEFFNNRG